MNINFDKCGLLAMEWNHDTPDLMKKGHLMIGAEKIPVVSEYTYLGATFSATGKFDSHVDIRVSKASGVSIQRMRNARSWIGRDLSVLLPQLTQCFAPCLLWGTDVISLSQSETSALDTAFFKFLRRVYRVKFDGTSFTKTNKQLLELSNMKPPSEILPLAHLKFFFHLLSAESEIEPEPYCNGFIEYPGSSGQRNNKFAHLASTLRRELLEFNILHIEKSILSQSLNQKNIFLECARFNNSTLASILGRIFMYSETTSPQLPQIDPTAPCAIFATDASFLKTEWGPMGSFAIVDTLGHSYFEIPDPGPDPSSTSFELAAIRALVVNLLRTQMTHMTVIMIVDSLSAIRLCVGKDVRMKEQQALREIDERTIKLLDERQVSLHYIHVRSHRRHMVPWNDLADKLAGEVWEGLPGAKPKAPEMKCKEDCQPANPCSACMWNTNVVSFLQKLHPTAIPLPLWQPNPLSRQSLLSTSPASVLASTPYASSSSSSSSSFSYSSSSSASSSSSSRLPGQCQGERKKEKRKKETVTNDDDEWQYHSMRKRRDDLFACSSPAPPPKMKEFRCPLCSFTCAARIGLFSHQKIHTGTGSSSSPSASPPSSTV